MRGCGIVFLTNSKTGRITMIFNTIQVIKSDAVWKKEFSGENLAPMFRKTFSADKEKIPEK